MPHMRVGSTFHAPTTKVLMNDDSSLDVAKATKKFAPVLETTSGLQKVVKLIANIALVIGGPGALAPLHLRMGSMDSMIDAVSLPGDINRFYEGSYTKEYKEGMWSSIVGNLALFVADIAGTLFWFAEFSILNLSKAAETIGNLKVFGKTPFAFVKQISLGTVGAGMAMVGFFFLAAQQMQNYADGKSVDVGALSWFVAEFASKVLFFAGFSTVVVASSGVVAALTGIGSMVFKPEEKKGA